MYMYPRINKGKMQNKTDIGAKQQRRVYGIEWTNDDKLIYCGGKGRIPSSIFETFIEVGVFVEVAIYFNCDSFIETTALLHANQGDIFPAVTSCTAPGAAAKNPNIHTIEINCHENVDVTRVLYSKGSITAIY